MATGLFLVTLTSVTRWHLGHADRLLWAQDGVISRRQVLEAGGSDFDIARMLRRRELTDVHRGVYVSHSGQLTLRQRHWAAVLAYWPAALTHASALPDPPTTVVHIGVGPGRNRRPLPRTVLHRMPDFELRADMDRSPPAIRLEHALIDVVGGELRVKDVAAAFAVLARVCATRRTSPQRILQVLATRQRVCGRGTLEVMLADLRDGACSVLERGYLHRVERAHGLPKGERQNRSTATGRLTYQDVHYRAQRVVVELDGRAFHDAPEDRDRDALRDLTELSLLRRRGWRGFPRTCPSCRAAHALTG